jgi:chromosome segregation ATPase
VGCACAQVRETSGSGSGAGRSAGGASARDGERAGGADEPTQHGRVPYFVLVHKLEEAAAALRLERDSSLEEVSRNQADLTNLDEQLTTAKEQLQIKTATIDTLMREQTSILNELRTAREATHAQEHKHEVLQGECVLLTRDYLSNTMKLEGELDVLRAQAAAREEEREAAIAAAEGE